MSRPAHPRVAAFADLLSEAGASGRVHELPSGAHTAAEAAAALGVPIGAIANSLVFDVDGAPLLVLTSGAHRVDVARVAALLGVPQVRRASADFVREHTGQPIGGVAPLGHPGPIGTLVDVELARHDRVWAAAGHPSAVFPTSYDELLRLTAGTAAEVGDGPPEAARAEAARGGAAHPGAAPLGSTPLGTTPTGTTHDPAAAVGP